jgi:RHS repeat-associated protein
MKNQIIIIGLIVSSLFVKLDAQTSTSASEIRKLMNAVEERHNATEEAYVAAFKLMNDYHRQVMLSGDVFVYSTGITNLHGPLPVYKDSFEKELSIPELEFYLVKEDYTVPAPSYAYSESSKNGAIQDAADALAQEMAKTYVAPAAPYDEVNSTETYDYITFKKKQWEAWSLARKAWIETGEKVYNFQGSNYAAYKINPGPNPNNVVLNQRFLKNHKDDWDRKHNSRIGILSRDVTSAQNAQIISSGSGTELNAFYEIYNQWSEARDIWYESQRLPAATAYLTKVNAHGAKVESMLNGSACKAAKAKMTYLRNIRSSSASHFYTCGAEFHKAQIKWKNNNPTGFDQEIAALNEISKHLDRLSEAYVEYGSSNVFESRSFCENLTLTHERIGLVNSGNYNSKILQIQKRIRAMHTLAWPMLLRDYSTPMSVDSSSLTSGRFQRGLGESGSNAYFGGLGSGPSLGNDGEEFLGVPRINKISYWSKSLETYGRLYYSDKKGSQTVYGSGVFDDIVTTKAGNKGTLHLMTSATNKSIWSLAPATPLMDNLTRVTVSQELPIFQEQEFNLAGNLVNINLSMVPNGSVFTPNPSASASMNKISEADFYLNNYAYKFKRIYTQDIAALGLHHQIPVEVNQVVSQDARSYIVEIAENIKSNLPASQVGMDKTVMSAITGFSMLLFKPEFTHVPDEPFVLNSIEIPEARLSPALKYNGFGIVFPLSISGNSATVGPTLELRLAHLGGGISYSAALDSTHEIVNGPYRKKLYSSFGFWSNMSIEGDASKLQVETINSPNITSYFSANQSTGSYSASTISSYWFPELSRECKAINKITGDFGKVEIEWIGHYHFKIKYFYNDSETPTRVYEVSAGGVTEPGQLIARPEEYYDENDELQLSAKYPAGFENIEIKKDGDLWTKVTMTGYASHSIPEHSEFVRVAYYDDTEQEVLTNYYINEGYNPITDDYEFNFKTVYASDNEVKDTVNSLSKVILARTYIDQTRPEFLPAARDNHLIDYEYFDDGNQMIDYYYFDEYQTLGVNSMERYSQNFITASVGEDWKHLPLIRNPKSMSLIGDDWTSNGQTYEYTHDGELIRRTYKIGGLDAVLNVSRTGNEYTETAKLSDNVMASTTQNYPEGVASVVSEVDGATSKVSFYLPGEADGLQWMVKSIENDLGKTTYTYDAPTDGSLEIVSTYDPEGSSPKTVTTTNYSKYGEILTTETKIGETVVEQLVASEHDQNDFHKPQKVVVTSGGITKTLNFTYHPDGSVHTTNNETDDITNEFVTDILGRLKGGATGTKLDGKAISPTYNGFTNSMQIGETTVSNKVDAYGRATEQSAKVATNEFKSTREPDGSYIGKKPAEGVDRKSTTSITPDGLLDVISSGLDQPGMDVDYAFATVGSTNCLKVTSTVLNENNSPTNTWSSTYYDGYGRVVRVESPHPSGIGANSVTDYSYDVPNRKVTMTPPAPLAPVVTQYSADWTTKTVTQGTVQAAVSTVVTSSDVTTTVNQNGRQYHESVAGLTDRKVTTRVKRRNKVDTVTSADGNTTTTSGANGNITVQVDKDGLKDIDGNVLGKPLKFTPQRNAHGRAESYVVRPPGASGNTTVNVDDAGRATSINGPNVNMNVNRTFPDGGQALAVNDLVNGENYDLESSKAGSTEKTISAGKEPLSISGSPLDGVVTMSHAADPTRALTYNFGPTLQVTKVERADNSGTAVDLAADGSANSYTRFSSTNNHTFTNHRDGEGYLTGGFTGSGGTSLSLGFTPDKLPNLYIYNTKDIDNQDVLHQNSITAFFDDEPSEETFGGVLAGYAVKRLFDEVSGEPYRVEIWKNGTLAHHVNYNGLTAAPAKVTSNGFLLDYNYGAAGQLEGWTSGALTVTRTKDAFGRLSKFEATTASASYIHEETAIEGNRRKSVKATLPGQGMKTWTYTYGGKQLQSASSTGGDSYNYNHDAYGNRSNSGANGLNEYGLFQSSGAREYTVAGRVNPGASVSISRDGGAPEAVAVAPSGQFSQTYPLPQGHNTAAKIPIEVTGTLPGAGANGTDAVASETRHVNIAPSEWNIAYGGHGVVASDWRWNYSWSDTETLIGLTTQAAAVAAGYPDLRLKFAYDEQGRRIRKIVEYRDGAAVTRTVTTRFVYDGWNLMAEETTDTAINGGSTSVKYYIWGLDVAESRSETGGVGALVAIKQGTKTYLPTYDLNGNVAGLVDYATGAEVATWKRGPFGEPIEAFGNTALCPFGFATHYTDAESGLVYFGYRYYSPETGRWISREPLGEMESFNLYSYCHNDPVNKVDFLGLEGIPYSQADESLRKLAHQYNAFGNDELGQSTINLALINSVLSTSGQSPVRFYDGRTTVPCVVCHGRDSLGAIDGVSRMYSSVNGNVYFNYSTGQYAAKSVAGAWGNVRAAPKDLANIVDYLAYGVVQGVDEATGGTSTHPAFHKPLFDAEYSRKAGQQQIYSGVSSDDLAVISGGVGADAFLMWAAPEAYLFKGGTSLLKATNSTIGRVGSTVPKMHLSWIDDIPKYSRPHPATYLSVAERKAIISSFDQGAVRITNRTSIKKYKSAGSKDAFVFPKSEFDNVVTNSGGNLRKIEEKLGLAPNYLDDADTVAVFIDPADFQRLRVASGNEGGADILRWFSGGKTSGGVTEAILDLTDTPFTYIKFR